MNEEGKNKFNEEEIGDALKRFKRSLISGSKKYFDVSEFEGIVDFLLEEGDINASEIAAKQGIQIHPNAVPLHLKYAQVLLSKGKFEAAIKHLNFVEQVEISNPDVHLIKGSTWLITGDEIKAKRSFNKAIKYAGTELDDIYYHIATAYIHAGEIKTGVRYFEKAVQANPKNEVALYELGFFCDQQGDYEKSVKYYNQYLDIDPFNYTTWFNLGITYNKAGKYNKAIEAYEYAHVLNDKFHQSIFNIANAHANNNKFKEAIEKYNEYLKLDPENDDAYCYLGECYLNLDENLKSEQHYQKAIDINVDNDTAWFGVGLLMWIEKKYAESIVFIKKAIEIDETNSEYWLTVGKVYNDFSHQKQALKAFKKAARLDPENTDIWVSWGSALQKYGEIQNSIRILKRGIKNNKDAVLKFQLVGFLMENGEKNEALKLLQKAMEQDFSKINTLIDTYPKALKNKRLKKLVEDFRKENVK